MNAVLDYPVRHDLTALERQFIIVNFLHRIILRSRVTRLCCLRRSLTAAITATAAVVRLFRRRDNAFAHLRYADCVERSHGRFNLACVAVPGHIFFLAEIEPQQLALKRPFITVELVAGIALLNSVNESLEPAVRRTVIIGDVAIPDTRPLRIGIELAPIVIGFGVVAVELALFGDIV